MRQTLNKILSFLILSAILLTCTSCKEAKPYLTVEYLNTLANRSGISQSSNIDEIINNLKEFEIVDDDTYPEYLTYGYLALTINRLILSDDLSIKSLKENGFIKRVKKEDEQVSEQIALEVIEKAVSLINDREIENKQEFEYQEEIQQISNYTLDGDYLISEEKFVLGDVIYLESDDIYKVVIGVSGNTYTLRDASLEEVFSSFDIEGSDDVDFSKAIDVTEIEDSGSVYANNSRELLASSATKRFTNNGYNISYKLAKSGINARISKNIDGLNFFFDITVSNVKPSYVFNYEEQGVKTTYFKVDYKTVEEIGVSIGRYKNYYLDLKNADASSFMNLTSSIIKPKADEAEATIRICQIKVPLSGVPTLYLNVELLAKFYVSGKVEIVISNDSSKGFETRNGKLRLINDNDRDANLKIGGSTSSAVGLNFNIEAVNKYLMDIEGDLGIKAKVGTTVHLYDDEGNHEVVYSDVPYSIYDELSKENNDVKVCGDLSLYWLGKIRFNTSRTLLYKFGLSKDIDILDDKNQVFGNKSHIENFTFVDKCTRNNRLKTSNKENNVISSDKILLKRYSKVVNISQSYAIEIKALPSGYDESDLIFESKNNDVATCNGGIVNGISKGATEIIISTSDGKYDASLNVLISEGG